MKKDIIINNKKVNNLILYIQVYIDFIKSTLYSLGKLPLYIKFKYNKYKLLLLIRQLLFLRETFLNTISNLLVKNLLSSYICNINKYNIIVKKKRNSKSKKKVHLIIFGKKNIFNSDFITCLLQNKLKLLYIKIFKKLSLYKKSFLKESKLNIITKSTKQLLLNITFKKRNTFFNESKPFGKTIHLITVRQAGYVGRRRKDYNNEF